MNNSIHSDARKKLKYFKIFIHIFRLPVSTLVEVADVAAWHPQKPQRAQLVVDCMNPACGK